MSPKVLKRLRELIRQFPENGMKFLLENPANVRELLHLGQAEGLKRARFAPGSAATARPTAFS